MSVMQAIANLMGREVAAATSAATAAAVTSKPVCSGDNNFDGRIGLRVSAIFVILVGSLFGEPRQSLPHRDPTNNHEQVLRSLSTLLDIEEWEYRTGPSS